MAARLIASFLRQHGPNVSIRADLELDSGDSRLHLAFSIPTSALAQWEIWLARNNIEIENRKKWDRGGDSLYFRDPDGHLLEVATPGVWLTY